MSAFWRKDDKAKKKAKEIAAVQATTILSAEQEAEKIRNANEQARLERFMFTGASRGGSARGRRPAPIGESSGSLNRFLGGGA